MIRNYLKNYEKYSILTSILLMILGIFLIVKPIKSVETFIILFAIIMITSGILSFISYFVITKEERLVSFDLIIGLITIITGIFLYVYRLELLNVFPTILGIWIIFTNLVKMQLSINLSVIEKSSWILLLIINILMIIFGILLIVNPFGSLMALTELAGMFLLVTETINLLESIYVLIKIR